MATMSKAALEKIAASLEDLLAQVSALSERVAKLETRDGDSGAQAAPLETAPAPVEEPAPVPQSAPAAELDAPIAPEVLLAISAAVAAYLGKRAHVRTVRLLGSTRWSQQGRVSIQASHQLNRV